MKQEFKPMTWLVKYFDVNAQKITDYDVLKYREDEIKKLKKKCKTKEEFAEELKRELMCSYWSKCEYELIIELTEDNHILLKPWVGCRDEESATIDVTDDKSFDWRSFAEEHIGKQIYKNEAKIDIFDQLIFSTRFDELVTYLWTTLLPHERDNPKFHE